MLQTIARLFLAVLVSSCAVPAALQPPPALTPETRILLNKSDTSSVPACNRPALEVMVLRRESEKRDVSLSLADAWESADTCAQRERELQEQLARHDWWDRYGLILGVVAFGLGAAVGGFIGSAVQRTIERR